MMRKGAGAIGKVASSAIKMIDFDVNSKKAHTWIENRTMIVHHADDKTIKKEASLYHAIEKNPTASPSSNFQGNVNDINTPLRNKIVELKTFNPKDYKTGENYNQSKTRFKETIQKYNQIANLTGTDQEIKFDEESFKTKPFVYKTDLAQKMLSIAKGDKGPGLTESVVGNIREINNFDPTWSGKQADSHLDSLVDYEETAGDIAQFINQNNIGKTSKTPKDIDISQRQKFGGNLNGDNLFVTRG